VALVTAVPVLPGSSLQSDPSRVTHLNSILVTAGSVFTRSLTSVDSILVTAGLVLFRVALVAAVPILLWQLVSILSTPIASLTRSRRFFVFFFFFNRHEANPFFKRLRNGADCSCYDASCFCRHQADLPFTTSSSTLAG